MRVRRRKDKMKIGLLERETRVIMLPPLVQIIDSFSFTASSSEDDL